MVNQEHGTVLFVSTSRIDACVDDSMRNSSTLRPQAATSGSQKIIEFQSQLDIGNQNSPWLVWIAEVDFHYEPVG